MISRPSQRGFTLLELVISIGATVILIAGAMTLLVQQQRAYTAGAQDRAFEESGRMALGELTTKLREAGYGVDPQLVFDFGEMPGVQLTGVPDAAQLVTAASYRCNTPVDCRDRIDAPDELVFLTRNTLFSRKVKSVATDQVVLIGTLATPLHEGQLLQVMCLTGSQVRAYVTVGGEVAAAATPDPTAEVTVPLVSGANDFPDQTGFFTDACFADETIAVKVDRHRYHIATFDEAGNELAWGDVRGRPWLMLDTGTFDADGNLIDVPVVPDVEDLQLTYLYPPGAPADINRLIGDEENVLASAEAVPLTVTTAPPRNQDEPDAASRQTGNPANIQGVRIALLVRNPQPELTYDNAVDGRLPAMGNRPATDGPRGYRRLRFESTVVVFNMQSRYFPYPLVDAAGGRGFNHGGG